MTSLLNLPVSLALAAAAPPGTLLDMAQAHPPALEPHHAALVIIDAQNEYRDGKLPLEGFDEAVSKIAKLRQWAHKTGVLVVHVRHLAPESAAVFAEGSRGSEIVSELTPTDGEELVVKHLPNSFAGTSLDAMLKNEGRDTLIVTGFMTHMCVESTTRAALDLKYRSFVVSDATATRALPRTDHGTIAAGDVQVAALAAIADRFGWVVSASDVLAGPT